MKIIGETKFNIGDTVWTMNNDKPCEYTVCKIMFSSFELSHNMYDECGYNPSYYYILTPSLIKRSDFQLASTKKELMKLVFDM